MPETPVSAAALGLPAHTLSRRRLLAGLAAGTATVTIATGAALALDPVTAVSTALDPVFPAIEAHRAVWRAWEDAMNARSAIEKREGGRIEWASSEAQHACGWAQAKDEDYRLNCEEHIAFEALFAATPTTLPGLAALAAYGVGREAACHGDEGSSDVLKTLARGLAALASTTGRA